MLTSHVETSSAFVAVVFAALFLLIKLLLVSALRFTRDPFFYTVMLTSHVKTSSAFVVVVFAALFLFIGLLLFGALRFTGDPFFQGNRDGTAVASKVRL